MILTNTIILTILLCQTQRTVQEAELEVLSTKHRQPLIQNKSRKSRALVFPDPSTLLLIFGLGTPLQLDRESVIVGVFTKMIYNLPTNATDFTEPGVYYTRAGKSRWSIYKMFEKAASFYGLGGKECLLKAICEVALTPFDTDNSLLAQLIEAFFKPSSTTEEYDEYGDREYRAAERLGEQHQQTPDAADADADTDAAAVDQDDNDNHRTACHALYPECPTSLLDVFSLVATPPPQHQ